MILAVLAALAAALPAVSPGDLLIDGAARQAFVQRWSPAFLRVHYKAAPLPGEDPDMRPWRRTLATLVEGDQGKLVFAPAHRLAGVERVTVELADGKRVDARVNASSDPERIPMVRLTLADPKALAKTPALKWLAPSELKDGLRLWGVEWPVGAAVPDGRPQPVLIDLALGDKVEYPLERFRYVAVRSADGLALITADGKVACTVFRRVPGTERSSLCTPADAADRAPGARDQRVKTKKVDVKVL